MIDKEKVIKGLKLCVVTGDFCEECPYDGMESCIEKLHDDALALLKEQPEIIRCKDCKHGSLYCTEDVCGETLIECNRPDLGDVIEIHGWKWFCADGKRKEGGEVER